ncbi:hypothetical protein CIHG_06009 [Coccidioides immitis H538.4]|uniref:Uncharacterized protein n=3 Tax=Coccidioides immitis TaxID=5501 RepID=A0A0J8QV91_COCIT|nr:hypothetical protein CIRG_01758 [Coccidioides immitis RMSCC 2394]KMU76406.1 hypothetical protein CISG_01140 [Coccidioides immitis RMSCC 3703]KMU87617.1 hypothetical protein CIHG_06009 [Coccidioides immitis H538.4]
MYVDPIVGSVERRWPNRWRTQPLFSSLNELELTLKGSLSSTPREHLQRDVLLIGSTGSWFQPADVIIHRAHAAEPIPLSHRCNYVSDTSSLTCDLDSHPTLLHDEGVSPPLSIHGRLGCDLWKRGNQVEGLNKGSHGQASLSRFVLVIDASSQNRGKGHPSTEYVDEAAISANPSKLIRNEA